MSLEDNILRNGFQIRTERHRTLAEKFSNEGYCEITEDKFFACPYCDGQIAVEDFITIDADCPQCERTVQKEECTRKKEELVYLDQNQVYNTLRRKFKDATGLPHGRKNTLNYREHEVEYRFVLKTRDDETKYQVQILFEPSPDSLIECLRLYNKPILTVLAGGAIRKREQFEQHHLPYLTLGEIANAEGSELKEAVERSKENIRLRHIDRRVEIASRWCTSRTDLEAMAWDEFEHAVQAFLEKLFIPSKLLGGTASGEEVPDGVMGFTIGDKDYRFFWDAKYIEFSGTDEHLASDPHVPMAQGESHSLTAEYRRIADHVHQYMSDQDVVLDGIVLFSPRVPEEQLSNLQQKLNQFEHRRSWAGKTVYFPLDSLVELYQKYDSDECSVSKKTGFLMKAIAEYLTESRLHDDPPKIDSATGVLKFGIDDVETIFEELRTVSPENEMPEYEVYVSRTRRT